MESKDSKTKSNEGNKNKKWIYDFNVLLVCIIVKTYVENLVKIYNVLHTLFLVAILKKQTIITHIFLC